MTYLVSLEEGVEPGTDGRHANVSGDLEENHLFVSLLDLFHWSKASR